MAISRITAMKFRDHPLMSYKGLRSWPPTWILPSLSEAKPPRVEGEVGILTDVRMYDLLSCRIFIGIKHMGNRYLGCLFLDDPAFCQEIYNLLRICIGTFTKDVGDTDLSHTF